MRLTSPKSVLFVGAYPKPAPLERFVSGDLALRLQSLEWKVLVTSRRMGRVARALAMPLDIWRWRRRYALACVDVFSGPAFAWAEVACAQLRRLRKPYVLTLHGGNLPAFSRLHPGRVPKLLATAAAVTCPSAYLWTEMAPLRPDLLVLPNGLDLQRYALPVPRPPGHNLIWVRAFHELYNPALAIEALDRIRRDHPLARLTMIGPDKGDGSLRRTRSAVQRLGLTGAVAFPGAIPKRDVARHLAQAGVFLNTANCDNTPVSVLEALACGLPVVSTRVGGVPYLLAHGRTALLVPPGDARAMAAAVGRLLADPGLAADLGARGRQLAESFDWSHILPQWQELLAVAIRPTASPAGGAQAN